MSFDTLRAATRLRDEAGFDETQASVLVHTFAEGFSERFTTKQDLEEVDGSLHSELKRIETALRGDMEKMETSLRSDMEKMETSLRGEIEKLDTSVRTGMRDLENRMTIRLGGLMVLGMGVLLSLQRLLP